MARDPSYAEYVDARWFVLYRLAALLVGEEHAGAVAEAALVRAYVQWPDVLDAASPDSFVEGLLARTAAEDFPTDGSGGQPFDALPTRQRAVLVLRCFELLDGTEIARALGAEVAAVEADEAAGLAAVGLTEQELAAELERRSEATTVPTAPVVDLVARGRAERRRERRRRLGWSGRIAAALIVVVAGAALVQGLTGRSGPDRRPPFPADLSRLPLGVPPRTAYSEGLTLYLQGGPLILRHQPVSLEQAGQWVYLGYPSGRVDRVDDRTLETTTLTEQSTGRVVADPGGRYVAWVASAPDVRRPVVVVRVLGSRGETLREQQQAFPAGTGPFVLVGLDRNGDVYASRPSERDGTWVWRAGTTPAPDRPALERIFGAGNGTLAQVVPGYLVVETGGAFDAGVLHGTDLVYDQEVSGVMADFADPSGRRVVQVDDTTSGMAVGPRGVWVLERTHRGDPEPPRTRLRVPTHAAIVDVRWEDAGHVLVDVTDPTAPNGAIVRCGVRTAACELVAKFDGPHLLAH